MSRISCLPVAPIRGWRTKEWKLRYLIAICFHNQTALAMRNLLVGQNFTLPKSVKLTSKSINRRTRLLRWRFLRTTLCIFYFIERTLSWNIFIIRAVAKTFTTSNFTFALNQKLIGVIDATYGRQICPLYTFILLHNLVNGLWERLFRVYNWVLLLLRNYSL